MSKDNNRLPKKEKQVRDVKGEEPVSRKIEIVGGNTAILTVQFLNSINEQLIAIRKLLEVKANG